MRLEELIIGLNYLEHLKKYLHSSLNIVDGVLMLPHIVRLTSAEKGASMADFLLAIHTN